MRTQAPQPPTRSARRAHAAIAAALASALVASGLACGDDDGGTTDAEAREEYVAQVQDAVNPVAEQSEELIGQAEKARRIEELSRPLEEAERAYRRATDQLEAVGPPDEVEDLHAQLVDVHREITRATEAAAKAAQQREGKGLTEFREAGDRYARRSDAISRRFEQRGFDL